MDIRRIEELAFEFRSALDIIVSKKLYGRLTLFRMFPRECCGYTSDLLAEYLIDNGILKERICIVNSKTVKEGYTHCWLMIDEKFCLDITADQFNEELYFKKYVPIPSCCFRKRGTYFYECFDTKETKTIYNVGINTYGGDISIKLRKIYDVVVREIKRNS